MTTTLLPSGCCVWLIDLPVSVDAMVAFDEDGYASIYLNSRLSYEKQKKALRHELLHIDNDDAYNTTNLQAAERRADDVTTTKPKVFRASDLPHRPYKPAPTPAVMRDIATLKRLGILTDIKHDPLLNLPDYYY